MSLSVHLSLHRGMEISGVISTSCVWSVGWTASELSQGDLQPYGRKQRLHMPTGEFSSSPMLLCIVWEVHKV